MDLGEGDRPGDAVRDPRDRCGLQELVGGLGLDFVDQVEEFFGFAVVVFAGHRVLVWLGLLMVQAGQALCSARRSAISSAARPVMRSKSASEYSPVSFKAS